MIGPVLYLEMLLASRRGKHYVFRWLYVGWLVLQFLFLYSIYWFSNEVPKNMGMASPTGEFARSYIDLFVKQQLRLLILVTPAFAAGAITDEKVRGTFQYLLTADLTSGEIVTGKFVGRLTQVAVLALCGLPLLCFVGVFGGLDLQMLLAVAGITAAMLFALGAASILAAVWSKRTFDAVLGLYAVGFLGLVLFWAIRFLHIYFGSNPAAGTSAASGWGWLDPLDTFLNYLDPLDILFPGGETSRLDDLNQQVWGTLSVWGGIGAVCLGLAVWRLRPAYIRQIEGEGKKKRHWWRARRSEVSADPIRWKERQVEGLAPLAFLRAVPRWLGILAVFSLTLGAGLAILGLNMPYSMTVGQVIHMALSGDLGGLFILMQNLEPAAPWFLMQAVLVMLLASLIVGIRCSGAVSGERERQTWEALLLTPLETRELIRGKLWGIIGASYPYLAAYAAPAIVLSACTGGLAVFWTVIWLGVTWLAMYYVGAAGLWCSVHARGSWRSLLGTVGFGYVAGFVVYLFSSALLWMILALIFVVIGLGLEVIDSRLGTTFAKTASSIFNNMWQVFNIASCLSLVLLFLGAAKFFVSGAEKRVADMERSRHWKNEGIGPRRRRRTPARRRYFR